MIIQCHASRKLSARCPQCFSLLCPASGYWQVWITQGMHGIMHEFFNQKGLFQWNVMPFGFYNTPATLQIMDCILET